MVGQGEGEGESIVSVTIDGIVRVFSISELFFSCLLGLNFVRYDYWTENSLKGRTGVDDDDVGDWRMID